MHKPYTAQVILRYRKAVGPVLAAGMIWAMLTCARVATEPGSSVRPEQFLGTYDVRLVTPLKATGCYLAGSPLACTQDTVSLFVTSGTLQLTRVSTVTPPGSVASGTRGTATLTAIPTFTMTEYWADVSNVVGYDLCSSKPASCWMALPAHVTTVTYDSVARLDYGPSSSDVVSLTFGMQGVTSLTGTFRGTRLIPRMQFQLSPVTATSYYDSSEYGVIDVRRRP